MSCSEIGRNFSAASLIDISPHEKFQYDARSPDVRVLGCLPIEF